MSKVIPIRDFSDNETTLNAFGDWLNDRTRTAFEEKTEAETNAFVAGVRRFSYFIGPVPLCESTLAEGRAFRAEVRGRVLLLTKLSSAHAHFIHRSDPQPSRPEHFQDAVWTLRRLAAPASFRFSISLCSAILGFRFRGISASLAPFAMFLDSVRFVAACE